MPTDLPPGYVASKAEVWTPEKHRVEAELLLSAVDLDSPEPRELSQAMLLAAVAHLLTAGATAPRKPDHNWTGFLGLLAVLATLVLIVWLVAG